MAASWANLGQTFVVEKLQSFFSSGENHIDIWLVWGVQEDEDVDSTSAGSDVVVKNLVTE